MRALLKSVHAASVQFASILFTEQVKAEGNSEHADMTYTVQN